MEVNLKHLTLNQLQRYAKFTIKHNKEVEMEIAKRTGKNEKIINLEAK
jgi:hypothetical protein